MLKKFVVCALCAFGLLHLFPSPARAQAKEAEPHKTMYATDYHMWFSARVTLIRLLGGAPIVKPEEVQASREDKWWGEPVPYGPPAPGPSDKR